MWCEVDVLVFNSCEQRLENMKYVLFNNYLVNSRVKHCNIIELRLDEEVLVRNP